MRKKQNKKRILTYTNPAAILVAPNILCSKKLGNFSYETFKEFKTACENFFSEPEKHVDKLRSLLTENFRIIGA